LKVGVLRHALTTCRYSDKAVDNTERHFGLPGLHDDIARLSHNVPPVFFFRDNDKRHVIDEIDIEES
jgi:hypothetical protein